MAHREINFSVIVAIILLTHLTIFFWTAANLNAEIIGPDRRIAWQGNVGVSGDIINRSVVCATLSPRGGVLDDASNIQTALNNCPAGQAVRLNAGTFNISSPLDLMGRNNITLRGSGMGITVLKGTSGASGRQILGSEQTDYYLSRQTSYNLSSPQKGSTVLTTSTVHNFSPGDIILIDQLEDSTGDPKISVLGTDGQDCGQGNQPNCSTRDSTNVRPTGQMVKVISVPAANQVAIEIPLYWTYSKTPQAVKVPMSTTGLGIEDLTVDNSASGLPYNANLQGLQNSWILRVEFTNIVRSAINMWSNYRNTVRSCSFHDGYTGQGGGYTILMISRNSANLFEDNIVYNLGIIALLDGASTGNVFAYNYGTLMNYGSGAMAGTGFGTHGAHPMMNLFEGNYMDTRFRMDYTWGTTSHQTMFRNRVINEAGSLSNSNLVDLWAYCTYMNVVGNVLGTVGIETTYENHTGSQLDKVIYSFGEQSSFGTRGYDGSAAYNSVLRHANWDSVHGSVVWDPKITDTTLPPSLYLTAKPAWWGSMPWPAIGPDLSPMAGAIPAKLRFQGDMPPPQGLRILGN